MLNNDTGIMVMKIKGTLYMRAIYGAVIMWNRFVGDETRVSMVVSEDMNAMIRRSHNRDRI